MRRLFQRLMPTMCLALAGLLVLGQSPAVAAVAIVYNGSAIPAGYLANPGQPPNTLAHMLTGAVNGDLYSPSAKWSSGGNNGNV